MISLKSVKKEFRRNYRALRAAAAVAAAKLVAEKRSKHLQRTAQSLNVISIDLLFFGIILHMYL